MRYDWSKGPTRWIENRTLFVSVPFTWNLPQLKIELQARDFQYDKVRVGGPAVNLMPHFFDGMEHVTAGGDYPGALQRINPAATRTTTGCIRRCSFCAVPITEGAFVELTDWPDLPIVCDNNLLAASQAHFDRVCDRLEKHTGVDFNQGLDARILTKYHAERLARIPGAIVRLALDHSRTVDQWSASFDMLRAFGIAKVRIRTYVLCGFGSDPYDAWARCKIVEARSHSTALPQWFHPLDAMEYNAVLDCHREAGWNARERDRIMAYYYQHRGTPL
jgi:hypothetical protein